VITRKEFIKLMALMPLTGVFMKLSELYAVTDKLEKTIRMPVLFIGHGSPINAVSDNAFTRTLAETGKKFLENKPRAILVVSAHWQTKGTYVNVSQKPITIYDFGGFPEELYRIKYPSPGSPEFAKESIKLIKSTEVNEDFEWGLDHGAWTILKHLFPNADIPVFELSLDYFKSPTEHFNLAKELSELRNKGVLIIGSGSIVHNLRRISFENDAKPFEWAIEFDEKVKKLIFSRDYKSLINYNQFGQSANLSIPTNEHYLPMLYSLGLAQNNEDIKFIYEEIQNSSISMRCFEISNF
jgi:4,5-DOPA dioxygenase extradiol